MIKGSRRAEIKLSLEMMVQLFIVGVVAIAFTVKVVEISNSDLFTKQYIGRDVGLLVDSIYAAPNALVYSYSAFDNNFSISIKDNIVSVFTPEKTGSAVKFPYADDVNISLSSEKDSFDNVSVDFFKTSNRLRISSEPSDSFDLECSDAFSQMPAKKISSVLVDPSYVGAFPGKIFDKSNESFFTFLFSRNLIVELSSESSRDSDVPFVSVERRVSLSDGKDLSLTVIASDSINVNVFVRNDSLLDKRLACFLIDGLSKVNGLEKGSIRSISLLDSENSVFVSSSKSDVAVALSVSKELSASQLADAAKAVKKAVGDYNG